MVAFGKILNCFLYNYKYVKIFDRQSSKKPGSQDFGSRTFLDAEYLTTYHLLNYDPTFLDPHWSTMHV